MTTSDATLIDTNVLVYAADELSPFHEASRTLVERGVRGEMQLCITPQILLEFFAVVTDAKRVRYPWSTEQALRSLEKFIDTNGIAMIYPSPDVLSHLFDSLKKYNVSGQVIFDLYICSTMLSNGVQRIYTYNQKDFEKFDEIEVLSPDSILT